MPTPSPEPKVPPGAISLLDVDGVRVLRLSGEVDTAVAARFERRSAGPTPSVDQAAAETPVTIVDVSTATFLDSGGLTLVLRLTKSARAQGLRPAMRGATNPIRRVLEITGADQLFHLSGEDAEESVRTGRPRLTK